MEERMVKNCLRLIAFVILILSAFSIPTQQLKADEGDIVQISSISPTTGTMLEAGQSYSFVAVIDYTLSSRSSAILELAVYQFGEVAGTTGRISAVSTTVYQGSGQEILQVTVLAPNNAQAIRVVANLRFDEYTLVEPGIFSDSFPLVQGDFVDYGDCPPELSENTVIAGEIGATGVVHVVGEAILHGLGTVAGMFVHFILGSVPVGYDSYVLSQYSGVINSNEYVLLGTVDVIHFNNRYVDMLRASAELPEGARVILQDPLGRTYSTVQNTMDGPNWTHVLEIQQPVLGSWTVFLESDTNGGNYNVLTEEGMTFSHSCDYYPPETSSGPDVIDVTATTATINWSINEPTSATIYYGLTSTFGFSQTDPNYTYDHTMTLEDLLPGTQYHYQVTSTDPAGNSAVTIDQTFTTNTNPTLSSEQITPGNSGDTATNFQFQVTYTDPDNDPPDPNSVEVVIDSTPHQMSSSDTTYDDGAEFMYSAGTFAVGTHTYYFQATQGGNTIRLPASGSWEFAVESPTASGLSLTSDTYSIPLNGSDVANLTATVIDGNGNPLAGETVSFITNYTGGLNPSQDITDANGQAHTVFTPSEVGEAQVAATTSGGLSDNVTIDVYQDSNAVETTISVRLIQQSGSHSVYELEAESLYISNGLPVENTDIEFTVLGETGQPFGSIYSYDYDTTGNPVMARTDQYGHSEVDLTVIDSQLVAIKTNILGSIDSSTSYVQVGAVEPSDLQPFITLSFPGEITDLEMSPLGDALAATNDDPRDAHIFDPATYSLAQQLTFVDDEEAFAAAFTEDGSRLAISTDDEVVNIFNTSTYARITSFPSTSNGQQFLALDFSPNGDRIAVGEQDTSSTDPKVRIWDVNSGALLHTYDDWIPSEDITAVDWSPQVAGYSSGLIAMGNGNGRIVILNGNGYSKVADFWGFDPQGDSAEHINDLQWSPDGSRLAVASNPSGTYSNILIFDRNGNTLNTLAGNIGYVMGLDWAHNSDRLLSASATGAGGGTLRIWDSSTGQLLMEFGSDVRYVDAQWSADDSVIFAAKRDGGIEVYAITDSAGPSINITSPTNNSATQDSTVEVIGQITDPHLVQSAQIRVNGGSWSPISLDGNGNFNYIASLSEGPNTLEIEATDGPGNTSSFSINVTRLVDNDPPIISNVVATPSSGDVCTLFTVSAHIQDTWSGVDPASIVLQIQYPDETNIATLSMYDDGVSGGDVTAGDEQFTTQWNSCSASAEGNYYLDITAADNENNSVQADNAAALEIIDIPNFGTPIIIPSSPTDTDEVTISVDITDMSGIGSATLYYSTNGGGTWIPRSMSNSSGDTWQGTIPAQDAGLVYFKITASDIHLNSTTSNQYNYTVQDATPPTFFGWTESPANLTEDSVGEFRVTVSIVDVGGSGLNGQTPQFDYRFGAGGYDGYQNMINSSGDTWYFDVPAQDWDSLKGQTLYYKAYITDVAGNPTTSAERSELIDSINDAPQITNFSPVDLTPEMNAGTCLDFSVTATDDDNDPLSYEWKLDGNQVSVTTAYTYCPDNPDAGDHTLVALVSDGLASTVRSWHITVNYINTPPAIANLPDRTLNEDTSLNNTIDLWAYASDIEDSDNELTFSIDNTPASGAGVTIDNNRYIDVNPTSNWCGSTTVTIRVTDTGSLSDTDTFQVTVTCINDLPWIAPSVPNQTQPENQAIIIDLTQYENDIEDSGTNLDWYVTGMDHGTVSGEHSNNDILTFTPDTDYSGDDIVTLHLQDSELDEATQDITLTWSDTNNAPYQPSNPSPADGATNQSINVNLAWTGSDPDPGDNVIYDVYFEANDSTPDQLLCNDVSIASCDPGTLDYDTHYYWYVLATDNHGASTTGPIWDFTTQTLPLPGSFSKISPADGATNQPTNPTLSWQSSSNATSYEYCVDTSDNNTCNTSWVTVGNNTSVNLSGLSGGTTYHWQIRARNTSGTTEANAGTWWAFTTAVGLPGSFSKISPVDGASNQPTNPTLSWQSSSNATSYEYCIDTSNNNTCNTSWVTVGNNTSVNLSGLSSGTNYHWQIRAVNTAGSTEANSNNWWTFTTQTLPLPGSFSKISPSDGSTGQSTDPTLSWGSSNNATSYEYCYDTSDNDTCNNVWTSVGINTNINLSGLAYDTTYHWQVRARNSSGTIEANAGTWWAFSIIPPPIASNILINEVDTGGQDAVELYNADIQAIDMTGWHFIAYAGNGNIDVDYVFPNGFTLQPGSYVVIHEINGTDTATDLYIDSNISWANVDSNGATALTNGSEGIDFIRFGDSTVTPPVGTHWTGINPPGHSSGQTLGRNGISTDTDDGNDWCSQNPSLGAQNENDCAGTCSIPLVPILITPPDGDITNDNTPAFSWGTSANANEYQIQIDDASDFTSPEIDDILTTTSYILTSGLPDEFYNWRVQGRNIANGCSLYSQWSDAFTFTIDIISPSSEIDILPPIQNTLNFTVSWTGTDATSGIAHYDVQYRDGLVGIWTDWLTQTALNTAPFTGQEGHTYYFRSRAQDNAGNLEIYPIAPPTDYDTFTAIAYPVPFIDALNPISTTAGGLTFTLTFTGSGFVDGVSTVRWNGSDRPTSYVSATHLEAEISANDILSSGSVTVTVFNSSPGGGVSNVLPFTITLSSPPFSNILINELDVGDSDAIELYNYDDQAVNISEWRFIVYDSNGSIDVDYDFPDFTLPPGGYVILHETGGTDTATDLYLDDNIGWINNGSGAASLVDSSGGGIDFVRFGNSNISPPTGTTWTGINPAGPPSGQTLGRDSASIDSDDGSDWCSQEPSLGLQNIGCEGNLPGDFSKLSPSNGTTDQATNLTLSWDNSNTATSYEYCYDSTNNDICDSDWVSTGNNTSIDLSALDNNSLYYWQIRAVNDVGITEANNGNWWSFTTTEVISMVGPVIPTTYTIDDDTSDNSNGNGDGIINCGETIELNIELLNQGSDTALAVTAVLSTADPYVSGFLFNNSSDYPDIAGGETAQSNNDWDILIDAGTPNGHLIQFSLNITASNGGPWFDTIAIPVTCTSQTHPPNDDFDTPIILHNLPFYYEQDTLGATTANDDPNISCTNGQKYNSVWYQYTATHDAVLSVNTFGSDYDTVLVIWSGSRGNLQSVVCNDDFVGLQSRVEFGVSAGSTYHIEIVGFDPDSYGLLKLSASLNTTINHNIFLPLVLK